jgi:protein-S-isoprenylcysteine O-methyltransferase Ste14
MHTKFTDVPHIITKPPYLFISAALIGLALHMIFPALLMFGVYSKIAGVVLCAGAMAVLVKGVCAFRRAGTNVNPSAPANALVTDGPYRLSRNPLYFALVVFYTGLALLLDSFWLLVMGVPLIAVIQFGVILPEEKYLEQKFGDAYRAYKKQAPRWI